MAKVKYRVRGTKIDSPIYLRFSNGRDCVIEMKSGYFINPKYFNNKSGKVRDMAEFKDKVNLDVKLSKLETSIRESLNKTSSYTKEWLKGIIDLNHGIKSQDHNNPKFIDIIERFIEYKEFGEEDTVTRSTLATYRTTLKRIKAFETYKEKKYHLDEVGQAYKTEFVIWAKSVMKYNTSSYSKTIKQVKTICKYAKLF